MFTEKEMSDACRTISSDREQSTSVYCPCIEDFK